jgi:hypothetical protein
MIKHLITGGCSFSFGKDISGWTANLTNLLKEKNINLTYEHTGYLSQGQELIQKKVMLAIIDALDNGFNPDEILVVVMWSGTSRKAWYIDNPNIIQKMKVGWKKFQGGMSSQFLDLKNNNTSKEPNFFETFNGTKFDYNPYGGWYFTVDGSDCTLDFVKDYYMIDANTNGVGKVHLSLENIVTLQNFCKLHKVKIVHQFFMDNVFKSIEDNKNHQIINYLYRQLDFNLLIKDGMFEHIHSYLNVEREKSIFISHDERKLLDAGRNYFDSDGFHPGEYGAKLYCENVLFPFLTNKKLI